ncbi:Uma2 family endonuclease [Rubrivirga sp. S365]|uniref:Uma2 family endonuclease n=1 Tax=Rubrivirga litoralis TaxID=3075598 RepID=A0ABU3BLL6_9BACT|nr:MULTISPECIES: Uma2 family endonuclease [unclassified Rubrivirga]MDT0630184.1 Uma2 family endonuclease [Rubrivirga sp. F394]MDT7855695.1 Uma2 family endonuclease [Rubrivirga sp. S365]
MTDRSALSARLQQLFPAEAKRRFAFRDRPLPEGTAEFIDGEVIVHPPRPARDISAAGRLCVLLSTYVQINALGWIGTGRTLVGLTRNDYRPSLCFFGQEKAETITPTTLLFPAPDLAVEVLSPNTAARDRGVKHDDYAAHGVDEYWIVDAEHETVEQYLLHDDVYQLAIKANTGEIASRAVDGFVIPVRAVCDDAANLDVLRALLA